VIVESVDLKNYRNYEFLNLSFSPKTNIIFGDNAQGKTNILESLYVCATSKSHLGSKDRDIIRFGQDEAHIKLQVKKHDIPYRIDMHLKKNKSKGIAVNGIPIRRAVELFGIINIVLFSPEDLDIIKNGPSERRRFMDMELSQLDKIYLNNLVQYDKVVKQRNQLLKDISLQPDAEQTALLDIFDMQLVQYGSEVIRRRIDFITELNDMVAQIHSRLSGNLEHLVLKYIPCTEIDRFADNIAAARIKDLKFRATSVGPHKDDIGFFINEIDVRKFGSQGQKRTSALSLKLAEIEFVKKIINDTPILLLDDVLSELDSNRQQFLLDSIGDIQTIITCTGLDEFVNNRFAINKIFKVVRGVVENLNDQEG